MKILFDSRSNLELQNFGISIPLTDQRVTNIIQYLKEHDISFCDICDQVVDSIDPELLALAHSKDYVKKLTGDQVEQTLIHTFELFDKDGNPNRYDPKQAKFPLADLNKRIIRQVNGAVYASLQALEHGAAFYLGGGFHHGMSFAGRGFCHINDIIIAARNLQKNHDIKNVWIIDIDVHKGDGTAELAQDDPTIQTLSIHMAKGWPLDESDRDKEGNLLPWYIPSDVDIPIEVGQEDRYLESLAQGLEQLKNLGPVDFVFVIQGSDPYEKDQLPSSSLIKLNKSLVLQRDFLVYDFIKSIKVPHCHLISGGYGEFAHEPYIEFFKKLDERRHIQ